MFQNLKPLLQWLASHLLDGVDRVLLLQWSVGNVGNVENETEIARAFQERSSEFLKIAKRDELNEEWKNLKKGENLLFSRVG